MAEIDWKAVHRLEEAAASATRAADRIEEAARRIGQQFEPGYGGNGERLIEALESVPQADEVAALRDMLESARADLEVIRDALGVAFEPHQSLMERMVEAAQAKLGAVPQDWRERFSKAVYDDLAAADNQDVPLEEYPARILKVLDSIFRHVPAKAEVPIQYQGSKIGTEEGGDAYTAGYFDGEAAGYADFQERVRPWMLACFGVVIANDRMERNHRFLEEALELVQACGCTQSEAHQLVDYVFSRPVGEKRQEVGGVMVTLAALCLAQNLDMHADGETELARIWTKVEQIRAKQAAKPRHSPLPVGAAADAPIENGDDIMGGAA